MKKLLVICLLVVSLILCACSGHNMGQTKGVIDCYSISVNNGGSTVFSATYSTGYTEVHEYKNDNGDSIYTDGRIVDYYNNASVTICVYKDRYTDKFSEYYYSGFIGWLTVEYNYYLDLDNKLIESEIKWSKYLYSSNPTDDEADNKKAYNCARKNFYLVPAGGYYIYNNYELRLDMDESSLERHSYIKIGEDCIISYNAKWF